MLALNFTVLSVNLLPNSPPRVRHTLSFLSLVFTSHTTIYAVVVIRPVDDVYASVILGKVIHWLIMPHFERSGSSDFIECKFSAKHYSETSSIQ